MMEPTLEQLVDRKGQSGTYASLDVAVLARELLALRKAHAKFSDYVLNSLSTLEAPRSQGDAAGDVQRLPPGLSVEAHETITRLANRASDAEERAETAERERDEAIDERVTEVNAAIERNAVVRAQLLVLTAERDAARAKADRLQAWASRQPHAAGCEWGLANDGSEKGCTCGLTAALDTGAS